MENLFISVDPGFDSVKVIANGEYFKFPFNAVETDERRLSDYAPQENFMAYQDHLGTTWRVGHYAREMLYNKKDNDESTLQSFYTEERFLSGEFVVGLRTAIAMAILKTGLYDKQSDLEINLMVTLPHSCRQKFAPAVTGAASGLHRFSLRIGKSPMRDFRFTIKEENVYTLSQTIAAILGETSDIDGNICDDQYQYLSNGPTLVIDGGYYTTGMVMVSRGGSVDDDLTESNTDFAMKNVNMAVAEAVHPFRPDIKHYMVEYTLTQNGGIIRYAKDGKVERLDLKQLRNEKIEEVCQGLIKHINERYNMLLDINYVLVTGGTGAQFYPIMQKHYEESNAMDKGHFLLTTCMMGDKKLPIEYAIALGGYKGLRGVVT